MSMQQYDGCTARPVRRKKKKRKNCEQGYYQCIYIYCIYIWIYNIQYVEYIKICVKRYYMQYTGQGYYII
jgi:hypothetical protein